LKLKGERGPKEDAEFNIDLLGRHAFYYPRKAEIKPARPLCSKKIPGEWSEGKKGEVCGGKSSSSKGKEFGYGKE